MPRKEVDQKVTQQKFKFYRMEASTDGQSADVFLFGEIVPAGWEWDDTDQSAASFKKNLDAMGDVSTINLHINSPGGSVFEGVAIGNMLKQHKAQVHCFVDGLAASIASVIAMSGDTISMPKNAMLMIHNPLTGLWGNAADLRKAADDLDHINESMKQSYLGKAGDKLDLETLSTLMDSETWLSADEAVSYGLADEVLEPNQAAACVSEKLFAKYKHVPAALAGGGDPVNRPGPTPQEPSQPSLLLQKLKIIRGE
jgi:ATP-dependent Clp protease protease subunit